VVAAARGGVFKHFAADGPPVTDAGLIIETTDGRVAVSQMHGLERDMVFSSGEAGKPASLSVSGMLHWARFDRPTPLKQAIFHVGMCLVGRWCRTLVRRLLQRRLITGRRPCPVRFSRRFEFPPQPCDAAPTLRVIDMIELTDPRLTVRRMAFGVDHQTAYVAASGAYQDAVLAPWFDLADRVAELNSVRHIVIERAFIPPGAASAT
jgi:hypothetical protein